MDKTVIEEIANQLGMAVDQAGAFITENLPAYAGMKVTQSTMRAAADFVFIAICLIAVAVALVLYMRSRKAAAAAEKALREVRESGGDAGRARDDYEKADDRKESCRYGLLAVGIIFIVLTLFFTPNIAGNISDILCWSEYPQAMLMQLAMDAVG